MPRKPIFKRLPKIFERLDTDKTLERYCGVLDDGFDKSHGLAKGLLDLRSVDKIPDRFLPLMELTGHVWRSDKSYDWNRRRIRDAIKRASYKGSLDMLSDLIREHGGGTDWSVVDMASTLAVWSRQGRWNCGDSFVLAADYHHPGARVLALTDAIDLEAFLVDFEAWRPRGQVWYLQMALDADAVSETVAETAGIDIDEDAVFPPGGRWNLDLCWNRTPCLAAEIALESVPALDCVVYPDQLWNEATWNNALATSLGVEVELDADLTFPGTLIDAQSTIRADRIDITVDQGAPGNPISLDAARVQEAAEITLEET